jgi:hypothetical protein
MQKMNDNNLNENEYKNNTINNDSNRITFRDEIEDHGVEKKDNLKLTVNSDWKDVREKIKN